MLFRGCYIRVCVFPPYLGVIGFVYHHGIGCRSLAPTIAPHTRMHILSLPAIQHAPFIGCLVEPSVLLECRIVDGDPDIHGAPVAEGYGVRFAVCGGHLGEIGVAVEVSFPAGLEADVSGGVVDGEVQFVERALLPDVSSICIRHLLHDIRFGDVEDVEL